MRLEDPCMLKKEMTAFFWSVAENPFSTRHTEYQRPGRASCEAHSRPFLQRQARLRGPRKVRCACDFTSAANPLRKHVCQRTTSRDYLHKINMCFGNLLLLLARLLQCFGQAVRLLGPVHACERKRLRAHMSWHSLTTERFPAPLHQGSGAACKRTCFGTYLQQMLLWSSLWVTRLS